MHLPDPVRDGLKRGYRRWWALSLEALARLNERLERYDPADALVVAGAPRGGTTWLAETLAQLPATSLLWEPLYGPSLPENEELSLSWRPYLPEEQRDTAIEAHFRKLHSGARLAPAIVPRTAPHRLVATRRWIVKYCRVTRLVPWLTQRFPGLLPIVIVRHPCAVVASQLRHGDWSHLGGDAYQPGQTRPLGADLEARFSSWRSIEEHLAATWCIDFLHVLRHRDNDRRWITIAYEELLSRPHDTMARVLGRLGERMNGELLAQLDRPSRTTRPDAALVRGGDQLSGWRETLDDEQVKRVLDVVAAFGLTDVYGDALEPDLDVLRATWAKEMGVSGAGPVSEAIG